MNDAGERAPAAAVALVLAAAVVFHCGTTATPAPAASSDAGAADTGAAVSCPSVGAPTSAGKVTASDVSEASGIVASALNDGVYWVHNDSGDTARAFALSKTGKLLATLAFDKAKPTDIEDVAIEDESPGKSFLYFGDIGDNDEVRTELTIHRVAEPKLDGTAALTATSEKMTVVYPDGAHNAETLWFDPTTKDLLIVTKKEGGPSFVHRVGGFAAGKKVTTEKIATVDIDLATGGEISRDGRFIALRNYTTTALVWVRAPGESVADALGRAPCKFPVATEKQGEAFAFLAAGNGYVTTSEGSSPALNVALFE